MEYSDTEYSQNTLLRTNMYDLRVYVSEDIKIYLLPLKYDCYKYYLLLEQKHKYTFI